MEADFRFSLARLREYTEQVALLGGERAEQNMVDGRFAALVANFIDLVFRRMRVTAFTQTFGQISPIIPYVFTAPFYFAGKIELGVMTQTAQRLRAGRQCADFFVNYYTYLAGFKSVVDRLNSFDAAIDEAQALGDAGPAHGRRGGADSPLRVSISLPDGRRIVDIKHLVLQAARACSLPVRRAPANRRCSARSRASGPMARAASALRRAPT